MQGRGHRKKIVTKSKVNMCMVCTFHSQLISNAMPGKPCACQCILSYAIRIRIRTSQGSLRAFLQFVLITCAFLVGQRLSFPASLKKQFISFTQFSCFKNKNDYRTWTTRSTWVENLNLKLNFEYFNPLRKFGLGLGLSIVSLFQYQEIGIRKPMYTYSDKNST